MIISALESRICFLVVTLTAGLIVLIVGLPLAIAGGENGVGCGEGFKYDPAPFIGNLTVSCIEGQALIFGTVSQVGKNDCELTLDGFQIDACDDTNFSNLMGNDLRGRCIELDGEIFNLPDCIIPNESENVANFETVAAGGMQWDGDGSFKAKFIIMRMK